MAKVTELYSNERAERSNGHRTIILLALFAVVFPASMKLLADTPKPLSGHEIAERNKPGVILIEGVWQASVKVWDPAIRDQATLKDSVQRQIRAGLEHDPTTAMLREIAKDPDRYLTRSGAGTEQREPIAARGSGFIITPNGYIVTNAHVVSMDARTLIGATAERVIRKRISEIIRGLTSGEHVALDDKTRGELVEALKRYYLRGGKDGGIEIGDYDTKPVTLTANIPVFNGITTTVRKYPVDIRKQGEVTPGKDVAVVKVEASNLPTVEVGDDSLLSQGDELYILGFPAGAEVTGGNEEAGVEASLTAGRYSAARPMPGGWKAIQTDATVNPGNSGGPGFNDRGEVIGIATFRSNEEGVEQTNFLVPISVANQFIQELNIKPQDSEISKQYRTALAAYEAGDYADARQQLLQIKEESAGFPFVQEYIDRIPVQPASSFFSQYRQTLLWVGIVAVFAVAGFLMMKRRKPQTVPASLAATVVQPSMQPRPSSLPTATSLTTTYGSLQCVSGPHTGQRFPISKEGLLIGRDASKCQVVLPDDGVSKEHAWVVPMEGKVVLIDRGSTNGVYINSADTPKVSKVPLKNGDRILIGKSSVVFTYYSA